MATGIASTASDLIAVAMGMLTNGYTSSASEHHDQVESEKLATEDRRHGHGP
jgi:hypothetical protein